MIARSAYFKWFLFNVCIGAGRCGARGQRVNRHCRPCVPAAQAVSGMARM